jgi:hypothetical protein
MRNTADVTGGKPIAVLLQPISGGSAINPLVAFYDIHGGKREMIFFYFVPNTTLYRFVAKLSQDTLKYGCYTLLLSGQCARRTIAEVKQRRSVIGWVTKYVLSRGPLCFGRHFKPLVPTFAVVSTHKSAWVRVVDYGLFSLRVIHKEGLYPSSEGINWLVMMMMKT